jgi:hypothetical protein
MKDTDFESFFCYLSLYLILDFAVQIQRHQIMQREDLRDARFTCLFLLYLPWGQIFHSGLRSKTPGCVLFPLEPRFISTHKKSKVSNCSLYFNFSPL